MSSIHLRNHKMEVYDQTWLRATIDDQSEGYGCLTRLPKRNHDSGSKTQPYAAVDINGFSYIKMSLCSRRNATSNDVCPPKWPNAAPRIHWILIIFPGVFFFDPISLQSKKLWVKNLKTLASSCHFSMQHSPVYPRVSIPSRNNRGRLHNS